MLHFKNNLRSKWMTTKYCSQSNFWQLRHNNNMSCIMKNMIKHRASSLKCIKRVIVNGTNTILWTNPWITSPVLLINLDGTDII